MRREEFLNRLEEALSGEVSSQVLRTNMQYYRDYISAEIARGRSEKEVMEELGDPRLIARTIIEAAEAGGETGTSYEEDSPRRGYDREYEYEEENGGYEEEPGRRVRFAFLHSWKAALILAVVVVVLLLILSLVFKVALLILTSPVFWVLVIVWLIWRGIAGRRYGRF